MMRRRLRVLKWSLLAAVLAAPAYLNAQQPQQPAASPRMAPHEQSSFLPVQEGDYVIHEFHFQSGETLPELRIHYRTLGAPQRDANGHVSNAVLILHGTGGEGSTFLNPIFAGVLFGPGQLLDAARYYIVLPDNIGHGKSSKPSDGLRAHFPQYDYDDMVAAQHELLEKGLGVDHLRLILGTSMGCMHSFVWGETYPDYMDALMPLACQAAAVAGRNRIWRKMVIDGIRNDPEWNGGDYAREPRAAMEISTDMLVIAGSAPLQMQKNYPTRDAADKYLENNRATNAKTYDANDFLYAVSASRNYDPWADLEKIKAPVMWVNSADDFINPPELTMAETGVQRLKKGRFILIPASLATYGHGTHTHAEVWQGYLKQLLEESAK
jgi:homoserine O-acetyltransferase/O-succinyltransferase